MLFTGAALPVSAADHGAAGLPSVLQVSNLIHEINPRLPSPLGQRYAEAVILDARQTALDPCLLLAIVGVESHFKADSVSVHGAVGLGQLMPRTAAALHVNPSSPLENLMGTSRYLRSLLDRFTDNRGGASRRSVIAAYNAGPGAISRNHGDPTSQANATYVSRVLTLWQAARARLNLRGTPATAPVDTTAPAAGVAAAVAANSAAGSTLAAPDKLFWDAAPLDNPHSTRRSAGLFRRILRL